MKQDQIREAFNTVTPTSAQKARIRAALEAQLPKETTAQGRYQQRHTPPRRFSWLPAVAALLAVVILGGFVLGRLYGGTQVMSPSQTTQYNGLSDFYTSPLYQAIQEWQDYLASHTQEEAEPVSYPYGQFGCENGQMRQALDALCDKYGLTLQSDDNGGTDSLDYILEVLGLESIFKSIPQVESGLVYGAGGWFYPDGSVMICLSTTMSYDGSPWTNSVIYKLYTIPEQSFFSCLLPLGDLEAYDAWEYTTQDGVKLLLGRREDDAFLFTAGEDNVVYVDIGDFVQEDAVNGITGEAMEAFAETLDFAALLGLDTGAEGAVLQKLLESTQYQAMLEWQDDLNSSQKWSAIREWFTDSSQALPEPYPDYGCTSESMMEKLDDLCETYGLSLVSDYVAINDYAELLDIVEVTEICGQGVTWELDSYGNGYSSDGSFAFSGCVSLSDAALEFTFYRIMKDTFHSALLEIGEISRYETWEYSASDGTVVLLARDGQKALILVPREKDLLLVIAANREGEMPPEPEALEALADGFAYTLPPDGGLAPIPEPKAVAREQLDVHSAPSPEATVVSRIPAGTELTLRKRELINGKPWAFVDSGWVDLEKVDLTYGQTAYDPSLYVYGNLLEIYEQAIREGWDGARCAEADISLLVQNMESLDSLGYALLDLDGNGNKELLITDGNVIYDLYTLTDEGPAHVFSGWERNAYYLCDGNAIRNVGSNSAASSFYTYYYFSGQELVFSHTVQFAADRDPDNPWFTGTTPEEDQWTPITEEAANEILDSLIPVSIPTTPLSEHP